MSLANSLREAKGHACPPFLRSYVSPILPVVFPDPFEIVTIILSLVFGWITDRDQAQWNNLFGKTKQAPEAGNPLHQWMDSKPDGAQPQGVGCKKYVLGRGGAVLNPVAGVFFPGEIAADQYGDWADVIIWA